MPLYFLQIALENGTLPSSALLSHLIKSQGQSSVGSPGPCLEVSSSIIQPTQRILRLQHHEATVLLSPALQSHVQEPHPPVLRAPLATASEPRGICPLAACCPAGTAELAAGSALVAAPSRWVHNNQPKHTGSKQQSCLAYKPAIWAGLAGKLKWIIWRHPRTSAARLGARGQRGGARRPARCLRDLSPCSLQPGIWCPRTSYTLAPGIRGLGPKRGICIIAVFNTASPHHHRQCLGSRDRGAYAGVRGAIITREKSMRVGWIEGSPWKGCAASCTLQPPLPSSSFLLAGSGQGAVAAPRGLCYPPGSSACGPQPALPRGPGP